MKTFKASIIIKGTSSAVWTVLTDGARWTEWNTTIDKLEGTIALGEQVKVYAKISPGQAFAVRVMTFEPPHRMVWKGGIPLGLFKGERTYTLTPIDGDTVEFTTEEVFSGLMAPLITRAIPDLQPAFDEFVRCLKIEVEGAGKS